MRIFKFGGASVKDAYGVRNVAAVIRDFGGDDLLVVVSAMGKTTNALEEVVKHCYHQTGKAQEALSVVFEYHDAILADLFESGDLYGINDIKNLYLELECFVDSPSAAEDYDYLYDQIIGYGELISTKIVSNYLVSQRVSNQWLDARNFIITDSRYRYARVDWESTKRLISKRLLPIARKNLVVTQGFIGRGNTGETTTLGREGSDYSAAIFGSMLQAESITIWKDVAGVMSADPRKFNDAELISELRYSDAIELAYYGASVIHPKTIQPLQDQGIPLFVKSFLHPEAMGTKVSSDGASLQVACKIHKSNQLLLKISTQDFTFIAEDHLKDIFTAMAHSKVRVNLMQNSAIEFRCVIDNKENRHQPLERDLQALGLHVEITENLELLSVYHPQNTLGAVGDVLPKDGHSTKHILLQQNSGTATHFLLG